MRLGITQTSCNSRAFGKIQLIKQAMKRAASPEIKQFMIKKVEKALKTKKD